MTLLSRCSCNSPSAFGVCLGSLAIVALVVAVFAFALLQII